MRPDPNAMPLPEDVEGRITLMARPGVPLAYFGFAAFGVAGIVPAIIDSAKTMELRQILLNPMLHFMLAYLVWALAEGLRLMLGWTYRLGPERMEIHRSVFCRARCIEASDLLGIARGKGGRARLVVRQGSRKALVGLPLFRLSPANSRVVVDWVHRHAKDPKTRLIAGNVDWTDTTGLSR